MIQEQYSDIDVKEKIDRFVANVRQQKDDVQSKQRLENMVENLLDRIKNCTSITEINSISDKLSAMSLVAQGFEFGDIRSKIDSALTSCSIQKGTIEANIDIKSKDELKHLDTQQGVEKFIDNTFKKVDDIHAENMKNDAYKEMIELKEKKDRGEKVSREEEERIEKNIRNMPLEAKEKLVKNHVAQVEIIDSAYKDLCMKSSQLDENKDKKLFNHIEKEKEKVLDKAKVVFGRRDEHISRDKDIKEMYNEMIKKFNIDPKLYPEIKNKIETTSQIKENPNLKFNSTRPQKGWER